MATFRKKPVEIEAVQVLAPDYNGREFDGEPFTEFPEWLSKAIASRTIEISLANSTDYAEWAIRTLEGVMIASPGDWLIQGVKGEIYPCRDDIFALTYDEVK